MSLLKTSLRRLRSALEYAEHPRLVSFRPHVMIGLYNQMNMQWVRALRIATVIDIGANIGQSALTFRLAFPYAKIFSFEPIPECFDKLVKLMGDDDNFSAFNVGLGDCAGSITFERNNFLPSSSFLKVSESHKLAFPQTSNVEPMIVKVECLDEIVKRLAIVDRILIKLDVQGYESHVIRGGVETIKRASVVIVETSFANLYEDQPLFDDIYQTMKDMDFIYQGSLDQFSDPHTGQPLWADSIFVKKTTLLETLNSH